VLLLGAYSMFQKFCWWANQYGSSFFLKRKSCERTQDHDLTRASLLETCDDTLTKKVEIGQSWGPVFKIKESFHKNIWVCVGFWRFFAQFCPIPWSIFTYPLAHQRTLIYWWVLRKPEAGPDTHIVYFCSFYYLHFTGSIFLGKRCGETQNLGPFIQTLGRIRMCGHHQQYWSGNWAVREKGSRQYFRIAGLMSSVHSCRITLVRLRVHGNTVTWLDSCTTSLW